MSKRLINAMNMAPYSTISKTPLPTGSFIKIPDSFWAIVNPACCILASTSANSAWLVNYGKVTHAQSICRR